MIWYSFFKTLICSGILISIWSGCAPGKDYWIKARFPSEKINENPRKYDSNRGSPAFLLIYMIHGDGSYSFFDGNGVKHWANKDALNEALVVARAAVIGEVVIFHQEPRALIFNRHLNATYYHFRFGKPILVQSYSRDANIDGWEAEVSILKKANSNAPIRFFAYFGHEIVSSGIKGYSSAYPKRVFGQIQFIHGLKSLSAASFSLNKLYALVLISSCYSSKANFINALVPLSQYLIVSPGPVHLSYFSSKPFSRLSDASGLDFYDSGLKSLVDSLSHQSFIKLIARTQTEVSLAVYRQEKIKVSDSTDDVELSLLKPSCLKLYYRPAKFGPDQNLPLELACNEIFY
jgi:hypothetical protein